MGTAIDGLSSGLDTTSMINSLMAVAALPQSSMKTKVADDQSMIKALTSLKTNLTVLNSSATASSIPGALNMFTATSSSPTMTATATTSAAAGSIDVTVSQLASTKVGVTEALSAWPTDSSGNPSHLTLVDKSGKQTEITPASTSLDDVVKAINGAGGGASAVKVPAGAGTYRLQLTSTAGGTAGDFQAYQGTAAEVTAGTASDLFTRPTAAVVKPAQDATAILYAGTAAQQTISSSTNTFRDILPGVSITATAVSATPVTVTVASDVAGITKKAGDLVSAVNDALHYVSDNSAVTTTTTSTGSAAAKGGIFTGNSSVRAINDDLFSALAAPINGKSPFEYGITVTRSGDFTFDKDKLAASLAADPAGTSAAIQTIASRVADSTKRATDSTSGSVTMLVKGQQSEVNDLNNQISDWDTRLSDRRATLQSAYTNMEVLLGGYKAQSSWLTGQLAGLSSSSSN